MNPSPPSLPLRSPENMPCSAAYGGATAAELLVAAAVMVPASDYLLTAALLLAVFLYNFLEFHFIGDIVRGCRGDMVDLTFDPDSQIYHGVAAKCPSLHGRYSVTPWLSCPHLQTAFLHFFGSPPVVSYRRQLFTVHDGGTIALDWLLFPHSGTSETISTITKGDTNPVVVVVPGLSNDSFFPYVKHISYGMAKRGWNVVVCNHRGLGGISITSDCFYNAGWTEDVRCVVNYLHGEYPKAPLFAIGASIGANILVKYLGEEGESTPVAGAASVCSPWDLVVCNRFIARKLVQRLYDKAIMIGLKDYAKLHQAVLTRLANWEAIKKSRTLRDFDHHATRVVGKFETVDTFYRCCSSVSYVGNVSVPLLCINALDDPVCTKEAIPWDECRANKNIVLATTAHGGHLAFFEGVTGNSLWWVGAVSEYLGALRCSPYMHQRKKALATIPHSSLQSSIDKSPYVNVMEDGMVAPITKDAADQQMNDDITPEKAIAVADLGEQITEVNRESAQHSKSFHDMTAAVDSSISKLSRHSGLSTWLLVYTAIATTWPLVGSVLLIVFRKKLADLPAIWLRR